MTDYLAKYLKYKNKYLQLKALLGGKETRYGRDNYLNKCKDFVNIKDSQGKSYMTKSLCEQGEKAREMKEELLDAEYRETLRQKMENNLKNKKVPIIPSMAGQDNYLNKCKNFKNVNGESYMTKELCEQSEKAKELRKELGNKTNVKEMSSLFENKGPSNVPVNRSVGKLQRSNNFY